ncbi:MAG TPA: ABC transporter substrate-binding protein [Nocardioidaceae bacterium]|nr:ABC transporter substrate-binding protein [Nocardioidaceae bacterium]
MQESATYRNGEAIMARRRKTLLAAGAALGTMLVTTACGTGTGGSSSGDTYTLGVVTSQTGPASQLGVGEKRGAALAAAHINANGGINGKKLKLIFADDQSTPDQALQQTRDLLKQGVAGIVGSSVVANCQAIGPLVEQNGPVEYCLSPGIDASGYVWSASAKTDALAEETMQYWKDKGIGRVAIINTTDASGTDGARAAKAAAKKVGVTVTKQVSYDPNAVSVTSQLQQAMSSKPQALVVWATGAPVGVALKGIQQLGIDLPVMTTDGNLANAFLKRIADYTPKTLLIPATRDFWWQTLPKNDPAYSLEKEYHNKYQAKYGEQPDFGPGVAYDSVLLMAQAIKKAGSTDAADIKAALEKVDGFEGVVGTYHMSPTDHRGLTVEDVRMVQAKNGEFTYVGK